MKQLSECCKAPMRLGGDSEYGGSEGTRYFVCSKCEKPCDPVSAKMEQPPSQMGEKEEQQLYEADIEAYEEGRREVLKEYTDELKDALIKRNDIPGDWKLHEIFSHIDDILLDFTRSNENNE